MRMAEERKTYHNGMLTVTFLTPEEQDWYRQLKPGVTQTADMIRIVAIQDGEMQVLEQHSSGVNRIRIKL